MEVGFSSLGTFSRTFQQIVGESPSTYRRRGPLADVPIGKLGLEVNTDADLGFMRFLTVNVPGHPDRQHQDLNGRRSTRFRPYEPGEFREPVKLREPADKMVSSHPWSWC